jgi:AcrR family transcriptional regulator
LFNGEGSTAMNLVQAQPADGRRGNLNGVQARIKAGGRPESSEARSETLSRDQIVRAAIELLDEEGLEGLNMRALGERLGSAATAVYWHIGSKAALIALAGDQLWKEVVLPDPAAVDWRTAATSMASELYAMFGRHAWLLQAFGSYVMYGAGKARHDDTGLAIFEAAGFVGARAEQALSTVVTFVLGNALGPAATAALTRKLDREGDAEERMRETLATAREIAQDFPRLRLRVDSSAAAQYGAAPAESFKFGLQAILDGLEGELKREQESRRASPSPGRNKRARSRVGRQAEPLAQPPTR